MMLSEPIADSHDEAIVMAWYRSLQSSRYLEPIHRTVAETIKQHGGRDAHFTETVNCLLARFLTELICQTQLFGKAFQNAGVLVTERPQSLDEMIAAMLPRALAQLEFDVVSEDGEPSSLN